MPDDQPGDARDTLSAIERRLRDLESNLRSGASKVDEPSSPATSQQSAPAEGPKLSRAGALAIAAGLVAVIAAVAIALLVDSGANTPSGGASQEQIALSTGLGSSDVARVLTTLKGARPARGDAAAEVCVASAAAALVIVQPKQRTVGCDGLETLLTVSAAASGVAAADSGSRPCTRASKVDRLQRRRASKSTRKRASQSAAAADGAKRGAEARGASPAATIAAQRSAAARAGSRFDAKRQLRLIAVRDASRRCIAPTAANLRSGRYPLTLRIALLARSDSSSSPAVEAAAEQLRKALGGAVPVEAVVKAG